MTDLLLQNPLAVFAGAVALLILLGFALLGNGSGKLGRRVERLRRRLHAVAITAGDVKLLRDLGDRRLIDRIFLRLLPQPDMLRQRLHRTGRQIGLGTYGVASLVTVAVSGGVMIFFGLSVVLALPGGLLIGLWLPHMAIGYLANRRALRFTLLFPEAIGLMVRGVKSGLPITQSFQIVGGEIPDPVGLEFRQLTDQIRLGQSVDQALWDAAKRVGTPEMQFLVVTLSIQRETGGNLSETLENLDNILRRRRQMKLKVRAMSSEARASAMIIGALPFLMGAMLSIVDPEYMSALIEKPLGHVLLACAGASMSFGIVVMAKMVKFEI
jgi:tight adherence protein B